MFSFKAIHRVKSNKMLKMTNLVRYFSVGNPLPLEEISSIMRGSDTKLKTQDFNELMKKTNQIYDDLAIKTQRDLKSQKFGVVAMTETRYPSLAKTIFHNSLGHISSTIDHVSKTELVTSLSLIGRAKFDLNIPESTVSIFEDKIISTVSDYPIIDLISLVPYFTGLGYSPLKIIGKINEEDKYITVPNSTMKEFLSSLIQIEYTKHPELYVKVFDQLKLASTNMSMSEVCIIFERIKQMKDIGVFEDEKIHKIFNEEVIDFFSKRVEELSRRNSILSNNNLMNLLKNRAELDIQNDTLETALVEFCTSKMKDNFGAIIDAVDYFQGEHQELLIENLLYIVKDKNVDIRHLTYNQLAKIMLYIIRISDAEVVPFLKYLNKLMSRETADEIEIDLFTKLFFEITKYGYINQEKLPAIYYQYVNDICMFYEDLDPDLYVKVLWSLAYIEKEDLPNPLIPLLFGKLSDIKLTRPLTDEESAYFYQVLLFVQNKIEDGHYPPEYENLISDSVKNLAKKRYIDFDDCKHQEMKKEMGNLSYSNLYRFTHDQWYDQTNPSSVLFISFI